MLLADRIAVQARGFEPGHGARRRTSSASWVGRALREAHLRTHKVTGWVHRKADPRFAARDAAIEETISDSRRGQRTVVCLDEKTAVSVLTPIHPDT